MDTTKTNGSIKISGPMQAGFDSILTTDALNFIADLHRAFNDRRQQLLQQRIERQQKIDKGALIP